MLKTLLTIVAALPAFIASTVAAADTAGYPNENPVFTVAVPKGWQTKRDGGSLMLGAPDAHVAVLVQHISDVKSAAQAKEGLPNLAAAAGKTFGLTEAEVETAAAETDIGEFKGWGTEYKGKDKGGEGAFWVLIAFAPDGKDYYLITIVCSDKDDKATAEARDAIMESVKAFKKE
ncbi:MAG: hypothetical protein ABIP20_10415 [Chthoniobacteraceae bacterium]